MRFRVQWCRTHFGLGKCSKVKPGTAAVFLRHPRQFELNIGRIRAFLHSYGRSTNQGEVMVEFAGAQDDQFQVRAYFIAEYPDAA